MSLQALAVKPQRRRVLIVVSLAIGRSFVRHCHGFVMYGESPRQDRLPQRLRALQVRVDLGLDFADDGEAAVDFGDDAVLLGQVGSVASALASARPCQIADRSASGAWSWRDER
ncbi:MAG: hypothetical protein MZW92_63735 [Comamonadaceae bacterium]|nr:hypothetical protein [Comamonadaceae bacterium]